MRVALIGGSGFIGLAAAEAIAEAGGRPVICGPNALHGTPPTCRSSRPQPSTGRRNRLPPRWREPMRRSSDLGIASGELHAVDRRRCAHFRAHGVDDRRDRRGCRGRPARLHLERRNRLWKSEQGSRRRRSSGRPHQRLWRRKADDRKIPPLFSRTSALSGVSLRVSNPCGPYQLRGTPVGVIARFIRAVRDGQPIEVFGDGSIVRDYIDVTGRSRRHCAGRRPEPGARRRLQCRRRRRPLPERGDRGSLARVRHRAERATSRRPTVRRARIVLSFERLHAACGWRPRIPFEDTVRQLWEAAIAPKVRSQ